MDGHTDKQVCRLTNKEIDIWKNAQTDRWTDGWVKKQWTGAQIAGIQMDRHTYRQAYRWTGIQMERHTDGQTDR